MEVAVIDSPQAADSLVTAALRAHGSMTRHDLAASTGLSMATITRSVCRLVSAGVVVNGGWRPSTGGRPSELLAYDGAGLKAVGVSVSERGAQGTVLTLNGDVESRDSETFGLQDGPDAKLACTMGLLDRLLARADGRICGIGVAVPAVVGTSGQLTAIHEIGWDRLALGELLSQHVGMPVIVENDANCLALAEHLRGAARGVDNVVALVVSSGLGAGIIANGQLYRGRHHEAGEIGYLLMERASLQRLFPARGDLEILIGGDRLVAKAAEFGVTSPDLATLPHLISLGLSVGGAAKEFSDELLDLTALAVSAMCVVLDPEMVIIGGTGTDAEMAAVIAGVHNRLPGRILRVPRIEAAALGDDAIVMGAAQLALPGFV